MHIAMIPARMGSQAFKFKNRIFFANTADFLDTIEWFDRVIVSTNDPDIAEKAEKLNYTVHQRTEDLSGPAVSIKAVFQNVVKEQALEPETIMWLFYLPVLYKSKNDFQEAKQIIEQDAIKSLCSFIPARSHPYNCWRYDDQNKRIEQYIPNDVFRRQDLPLAWMHYHYLYCLKVSELPYLNSELINEKTHPFFLSNAIADQLIELDTQEDYEKWKKLNDTKQEAVHE